MRAVEKKVYYCDFCKARRLMRSAMEKHERTCTLNPHRTCRWKTSSGGEHGMAHTLTRLVLMLRERAEERLTKEDVDWLREQVSGCPACMLAALRQCGSEYHYLEGGGHWDYADEVNSFRAVERAEQNYEAIY